MHYILKRIAMAKLENSVLQLAEGIRPVDPKDFADFQRVMTEQVIPEIVKVVEERRLSASESQHWQLRC